MQNTIRDYTFNQVSDLRGTPEQRRPLGRVTDKPIDTVEITPIDLTLSDKLAQSASEADVKRAALQAWDELSTERGQLLAYFIEDAWAASAQTRTDVIDRARALAATQGPLAYSAVLALAAHAFDADLDAWEARYEARAAFPFDKLNDTDRAYLRLREIGMFGQAHGIIPKGSPRSFIQRGYENGASDTWRLLEAVPRAFKEQLGFEPTDDIRQQLFVSCSNLLAKFSAANIRLERFLYDFLTHVAAYQQYGYLEPDFDLRVRSAYLTITAQKRGDSKVRYGVDISKHVLEQLAASANEHMHAGELLYQPTTTIGCPGLSAMETSNQSATPRNVVVAYGEWCLALTLAAMPAETETYALS